MELALETYAALLNLKIVVPSNKTNYVAVDSNYWRAAVEHRIAKIYLDENWYMQRYPDVAKAVQGETVSNARQHYCQSGYFEHRMPYRIEVDGEWYMSEYPDVKEAVVNRVFGSPQDHFERLGFQEGRFPFPEFALRQQDDTPPSYRSVFS